jgi:hypothetical protein
MVGENSGLTTISVIQALNNVDTHPNLYNQKMLIVVQYLQSLCRKTKFDQIYTSGESRAIYATIILANAISAEFITSEMIDSDYFEDLFAERDRNIPIERLSILSSNKTDQIPPEEKSIINLDIVKERGNETPMEQKMKKCNNILMVTGGENMYGNNGILLVNAIISLFDPNVSKDSLEQLAKTIQRQQMGNNLGYTLYFNRENVEDGYSFRYKGCSHIEVGLSNSMVV